MKRMVLLWGLFVASTLFARNEVTVFCYHTFLGKPSIETDFSLAEFSEHIDKLQAAGYRFVSLAEVNSGSISGEKNIMLMFDDGHRTAAEADYQVLSIRKIPAVFAIFPGTIDSKLAMSWRQVAALAAIPGNAIAAHGYWHEKLFDRFATTHPQNFIAEFERPKKGFKEKIGLEVTVCDYPYGVISASAKEQLKKSGYAFAYGLVQKPLLIPLNKNPDLLALPRTMMTRPLAAQVLASLLKK